MKSRTGDREQGKLALQIRISYLFLLIPIVIFLIYVFHTSYDIQ